MAISITRVVIIINLLKIELKDLTCKYQHSMHSVFYISFTIDQLLVIHYSRELCHDAHFGAWH